MQTVTLYASATVLVLLTLTASTFSDIVATTVSSGVGGSLAPVTHNDTSASANKTSPDAQVQNDESKTNPPSIPPTRVPVSDAATLVTKPPIVHTTKGLASTMNTNNAINTNETMGSKGAKTGEKKSGASRGRPELLVMGFIALILSAAYA